MDEHHLLVLEHKCNGRKLVPNGLSILSEEDLVMIISARIEDPDIIMIIKPIEAGQVQFDLFKADFLPDTPATDAKMTANKTNTTTRDAAKSGKVPWRVFLGHEWKGHSFESLTILTLDPTQASAKPEAETKSLE